MTATSPTADQLSKLPRWAQAYIASLEFQRDKAIDQHAELFDSQEETSVLYGDVYRNPKYLPDKDGLVRFEMEQEPGDGMSWVDLRPGRGPEKGFVSVMASSPLVIHTQASNTLLLGLR